MIQQKSSTWKKASKLFNEYALDAIIGFILAAFLTLFLAMSAHAQNVGINNPTPNPKALLDLTSIDKGLLAPRMTQTQRTAMFPVADATAKGMLVYQTDNVQGFYYYDGAAWQFMSTGNSGWGLTGNTGTNPAVNFMGTMDNNDVVFKSNNTEGLRIKSNQNVGVGVTNPIQRLDVKGSVNILLDSSYRINNKRVLSIKGPTSVYVGQDAGLVNTGYQNSFLGCLAGYMNTTGVSNTFLGSFSGYVHTTGSYNSYVGALSGYESTTGSCNTFIGTESGSGIKTGSHNTYIGFVAGSTDSSSNYNVCIGSQAGLLNKAGYQTFVGTNAGKGNTTGTQNTFIGLNSGFNNATGANNTFLGYYTGFNTTGSGNTFLGNNSGVVNTTGSGNTFIGAAADATVNNLTNAAAFGNNAKVSVSNGFVLGNAASLVGIGLSSPGFPLNFQSTLGDKVSFYGNSGAHYGIGIQAALMQIHTAAWSDDIAFGYGSSSAFSERMRIKGTGKVGIGTSNPGSLYGTALLELADSTGSNRDVIMRSTNNTNYHQVLAFIRTRGTYSAPAAVQQNDNLGRFTGMGYDGTVAQAAAEIQFHVDSVPGANSMPGNMTFHTTPPNTGSVCQERMRIDRNGNIGVGTASPTTKLHVNGGFRLSDGTEGAGKILTSDATGKATWQSANGAFNGWGLNGNAGTTVSNFIGTTDAADLHIRTNGISRLAISAGGNIGIGVMPTSAKLAVYTSTSEGISVSGGNQYNGITAYVAGSGFANNALYGENGGIGVGVQGYSNTLSGFSVGVRGGSKATTGIGVEGYASDSTGINFGVKGTTASPLGYSGYFMGGRHYIQGNTGFGTPLPQTKVDIEGALTVGDDATLSANAALFNVTVGNRTYYRINSNSTPSTRVLNLSNGLATGQLLIIECAASGTNGIRVADLAANNTNTVVNRDMLAGDIITMIWNGADWMEVSYSDN